MKNVQVNANNIRQTLDKISEHYQNHHGMCHPTSGCKEPGYIPSIAMVASPVTVNAIKQLFIYKHPEKYVTCRDTLHVESCNNIFLSMLINVSFSKDPLINWGPVLTYLTGMNMLIVQWHRWHNMFVLKTHDDLHRIGFYHRKCSIS